VTDKIPGGNPMLPHETMRTLPEQGVHQTARGAQKLQRDAGMPELGPRSADYKNATVAGAQLRGPRVNHDMGIERMNGTLQMLQNDHATHLNEALMYNQRKNAAIINKASAMVDNGKVVDAAIKAGAKGLAEAAR
jgi:hypothetical protein